VNRPFRIVAAIVAALGLVISTLYLSRSRRFSPPPTPVPLTSFEGLEIHPALSPDGEKLAFSWDRGEGAPNQIYVLEIGVGEPQAITSGPGDAESPVWSPDGLEIAFLRRSEEASKVVVVSSTGGEERTLVSTTQVDFPGLDWSPDGSHIALVDKNKPTDPNSIYLLSIETGERRRLTSPPPAGGGDRDPAFSPDGSKLAFVRWSEGPRNVIYITELGGDEPKRLTLYEGFVRDIDWLADGSALIFPSMWRGIAGLWVISTEGGNPTRLTFGENARNVSVSPAGQVAYSTQVTDANLWRVHGPGSATPSGPERFINSTRQDFEPQYSPNGGQIAITSDRSGDNHIWICKSNGKHCKQLTPQGAVAVAPRWSPDEKSIAFTEISRGNPDIYLFDFSLRIPHRLTREDAIDVAWSWSRDGRWLYFFTDRTGRYEVWRLPIDGGDAEQLTDSGGAFPLESHDGREIYYMKLTSPRSIWRRPLEGRDESLLFEAPISQRGFTLWEDEIIYLRQDPEKAWVEAYNLATGEITTIADLGEGTRLGGYGRHTVSPDGRSIVFTREDGGGSDILMVDGRSLKLNP
jgi:Tol biopolymer transport system component